MIHDSAHYAIKSLHDLPAKEQIFDPIWIIYGIFICLGMSFPLISLYFTNKENELCNRNRIKRSSAIDEFLSDGD